MSYFLRNHLVFWTLLFNFLMSSSARSNANVSTSTSIPPQHQDHQPGTEEEMRPQPIFDDPHYIGSHKLKNKIAVISGGDSGIGRATAIAFAKEDADIAILYLNEHEDANDTKKIIESKYGRKVLLISGDIGNEDFCKDAVKKIIKQFGKINILVNNAAEHQPQSKLEDISAKQLQRTFQTNVFGVFYLTKAVLPYLHQGDSIINTASVVAYKGNGKLIDYAATKGAMIAFTRSLAANLAKRGIRVNAVAPGPIWTPLIPSSFSDEEVEQFGQDVPLGRVGQPAEVATSFVFLASDDSSYMTGQVLHPNGGVPAGG